MVTSPSFTMGIEEEYLLVHIDTLELAEAPQEMMDDCIAEMGGQVSPEFLRCQVEIGTSVCKNITEAREDLKRLRSTVAKIAGKYGMAPLAVSCHPTADWKDQHHTDKERYNTLDRDLAGVARRLLISGMHVHIGVEDDDLRIDLMNQFAYFLPHLLALSCSSPFWQGQDTGLSCYRLTIFDNVPRTGLPPVFHSYAEYDRSVQAIINTGAIEDSTKIWWDLRPSANFPTLETRIMDVQPRLEDTLTLAALNQCILRMLWRLRTRNQRWRLYDLFLVGENRWRAQRYGVDEGLIDFGRAAIVPMPDLMEELVELIEEDGAILGCLSELEGARSIAVEGNSTRRQRAVRQAAADKGAEHGDQMRAVVAHLIEEYHEGL